MDRRRKPARSKSVRVSFAEFEYVLWGLNLQTHTHALNGTTSVEYYVGTDIVAMAHHNDLSPGPDDYFVYLVDIGLNRLGYLPIPVE